MKIKVDLFCLKDIKDISFDCTNGNIYSVILDTNSSYFGSHIKHLVTRLNDGSFKVNAPWRYIPKHREYVPEVYSLISELTNWCENFYLELEKASK